MQFFGPYLPVLGQILRLMQGFVLSSTSTCSIKATLFTWRLKAKKRALHKGHFL